MRSRSQCASWLGLVRLGWGGGLGWNMLFLSPDEALPARLDDLPCAQRLRMSLGLLSYCPYSVNNVK
eukprot:156910-Karenia_brevis.AAC.1